MKILWACGSGLGATGRREWVRSVAATSNIAYELVSLETADTGLPMIAQHVSGADITVADFAEDDGPLSLGVVVAATLARYCHAKPVYILTEKQEALPFDWQRHGQCFVVTPGMGGCAPLQDWFRRIVTAKAHFAGGPLGKPLNSDPPEVFVAMPFQGHIPREIPAGAFDFSRFLRAVDEGASLVPQEPRPRVVLVGRDAKGGDIFDDITTRLAAASVVVADFSPDLRSRNVPNPNVVTEATIARAGFGHDQTFILCAQQGTHIPSSWRTFDTVVYDRATLCCVDNGESLSSRLAGRVAKALSLRGARQPGAKKTGIEPATGMPRVRGSEAAPPGVRPSPPALVSPPPLLHPAVGAGQILATPHFARATLGSIVAHGVGASDPPTVGGGANPPCFSVARLIVRLSSAEPAPAADRLDSSAPPRFLPARILPSA